MAALIARPLALKALKANRAQKCSGRRIAVCRAENKPQETINYGGQSYTPAEWEAAKASGNLPTAEPVPVAAASTPAPVGFSSLMAFSGPAPELINGRLAMLGVVAAIAAELASGESVLKQVSDEPTGIVFAFGIFIAASFAPLLSNVLPSAESVGPFNAKAELINGRAAMIGFAALLAIELAKGSALF
ncbi:Carotene biosynthesis-related protein CBR [Monoraphidium neglectum]|uniref:Carotene biosynthesis-related protein CBR n=1 Tax=Monoraphidium neglectum TaxID=145388 RepID=A0A0D2N6N2_9CHLO|nr:Carotene biosynthesis-related protein CBR [Monoraphidium neglectum]KIZ07947.1 Carotene biosynthesis-related protein CBR [Monoraphidium neglectum]|eukprot:XP_013906966.1 Carotene biosynthesis-related protein CBR [Monoraphidium neglectum]